MSLKEKTKTAHLTRPPDPHAVRTVEKKYLLVAESEYLAQQAVKTLGLSSEWMPVGVHTALMGRRFDRIVVFNASSHAAFAVIRGGEAFYKEFLSLLTTKFDRPGRKLEFLP